MSRQRNKPILTDLWTNVAPGMDECNYFTARIVRILEFVPKRGDPVYNYECVLPDGSTITSKSIIQIKENIKFKQLQLF